jgi:FtsZ-binding cell division protein ZapB
VLCGRLASLKGEPRYTHSVEQTRGHTQRLHEEISRLRRRNGLVLQNRQELQEENSRLRRRNEQILQENEQLTQRLQERVRGYVGCYGQNY